MRPFISSCRSTAFALDRQQLPLQQLSQLFARQRTSRIVRHASYAPFETRSATSGFAPPDPASLGKPRPAKQYTRSRKYGRRLFYVGAVGGSLYLYDRVFNYSTFMRSLRTFYTGFYLTLDYKFNFKPEKAESIHDLHERSANRIFDVLSKNGGLYLKVGQALAMQSAVLPPSYQKKFAKLFDEAPQASWAEIEKVFKEEYGGRSPDEIFMPGTFEQRAVASASIAQVHRARLKTGEEVAVKIQKPQVPTWVVYDLGSWKILMRLLSWYWDLPFYFVVDYVVERLQSETDFRQEARNSMKMAECVASDASLRERVYIPKTFPELNTRRVMVAEWIDGVKLWDKEAIEGPWKGKEMVGKELKTRRGAARSIEDPNVYNPPPPASSKDQGAPVPKAGLGLSLKDVMKTMVDLFSAQMFVFGEVHADPHPGNVFIRRTPAGKSQLVLIDHGLYVHLTPEFRHLYCEFWTSLLTFDNKRMGEIAEEWGIGNVDMFASATLLRPYEGGDKSFSNSITGGKEDKGDPYEMQQRMRDAFKQFLKDTPKIPRELVFLGRNMRIVQGNNQFLGSPVNRIKLTALGASRGLLYNEDGSKATNGRSVTWRDKFRGYWKFVVFRAVMITFDVAFYAARVKQMLYGGGGFEDELENQMRRVAKNGFGVELRGDVFAG